MISNCTSEMKKYIFNFEIQLFVYSFTCTTYMGRITLYSIALHKHYLAKMCVELALQLLVFEKVIY